MKSLLLIISITLSISLSAQNDFKKSSWGDSIETIKKTYPNEKWESEHKQDITFLSYNSIIGGLDAIVSFYLIDNKLLAAGYIFTETHTNDNLYIIDYDKINDLLKNKYALKVDYQWNQDIFKNKKSYYGKAISMGHLKIVSTANRNSDIISHSLMSDNHQIDHTLMYKSDAYQKFKEQANNDDF